MENTNKNKMFGSIKTLLKFIESAKLLGVASCKVGDLEFHFSPIAMTQTLVKPVEPRLPIHPPEPERMILGRPSGKVLGK